MKELSRSKRLDVAQYYLLGYSYREIEEETSVSHGSIANIIKEIEVAPGLKHPTARSTKCDKVYICTRGQISFWVNDNNIELKPRDSLFINKGEWFRYENNTEFPGELHLIHTPRFDMAFEEFKDD